MMTRDQLIERLGELLDGVFPGDFESLYDDLEFAVAAEQHHARSHGGGKCISRKEHDEDMRAAVEAARGADVKAAVAEAERERDEIAAQLKAASEQVKVLEADSKRLRELIGAPRAQLFDLAELISSRLHELAERVESKKRAPAKAYLARVLRMNASYLAKGKEDE